MGKKKSSRKKRFRFSDLVALMKRLRGPGGCPWDRKQNHRTLLPYLLEETYEVIDSVQRRNMGDLSEELGDLLLQIVFHAQMAEERSQFDIEDVVDRICQKLIARHPHVFGQQKRLSANQVLDNWEKLKLAEPRKRKRPRGVLDGVPRTLPALLRAYRIQEKTARFGFDWSEPQEVLGKVTEEVHELESSLRQRRKPEIEHELGDLLFALVNLARHLRIDPEGALAKTNRRFIRRFEYIEKNLPKSGKDLTSATLEEMDALWDEAKKRLGKH
jgi:tetrapyrrole methylase family protein/MazG family protein